VLARIDTERSFFQLKDSVQQLVRGVIEAYWALVFAHTEAEVRRRQVVEATKALRIASARETAGTAPSSERTQAESDLEYLRASAIAAEADLLQREAALRNILGLPPSDAYRIVPVTPLNPERLEIEWEEVVRLAEDYRPDLIELKLILEADEQRLLLARNDALPSVDASALYRWNGLEGRTPERAIVSSGPGEFTGWQLGVSFSVPLGLRQSRAELRQQELIIMRDRANLQQGLHNTTHLLATSYRNAAQYYEQYRAFTVAHQASELNLFLQGKDYLAGRTKYLDYRQAIVTAGNARSAEEQTLAQYNTELANLELQTGTILEAHGIRFYEELYGSIGPLGRLFRERCYPRDYQPGPNTNRYPETAEPAEKAFGLVPPTLRLRDQSGGERSSPSPGVGPPPLGPSPNPERLQITVPEPIPPPAPGP
jgi:outer membrane protein TolC